jgi:hypothetical protein
MPATAAPQALSYGTPTFDIFFNYQKKKTNRTVFHDLRGFEAAAHMSNFGPRCIKTI